MRKNYLIVGFEKTISQQFPARAPALRRAMQQRLDQLREDFIGVSQQMQVHLEGQILPGIAVYEMLQTVLPKEQALQCVHDYVEQRAWKIRHIFVRLLRLPGLYRRVPPIFEKSVHKMFGASAGFTFVFHPAPAGSIRFDMTRCPYHTLCGKYGCPELCHCFCDSDDITYDNLHPKLLWHRTKTLGRGDDCCDFGLSAR